jgi:copper transport protein
MFVSSHGLVRASHGGLGTRFGLTVQIASAIAATGAAAAAIAVADRSAAPYGVVLAVLLLPVPSVAGHALDPGRSWLAVPVDILHVTAAAMWVGGLFALVVIVPLEGVPPETVRRAARRFSTFALASVVAVALTGALRAVAELSAFSQLWTTSYGRAILAKTAIFAMLLGLGALSRATLREGAPPEIVARAARRFSTFALGAVVVVAITGLVRALSELSAASQLWTTSYGRAILAKTAIFAVLLGLGVVSRATLREGAGLRNIVRLELALALALAVAVAILTSLRPGRS